MTDDKQKRRVPTNNNTSIIVYNTRLLRVCYNIVVDHIIIILLT